MDRQQKIKNLSKIIIPNFSRTFEHFLSLNQKYFYSCTFSFLWFKYTFRQLLKHRFNYHVSLSVRYCLVLLRLHCKHCLRAFSRSSFEDHIKELIQFISKIIRNYEHFLCHVFHFHFHFHFFFIHTFPCLQFIHCASLSFNYPIL